MQAPNYNFYLNPHDYYKWTKCPKCDSKTKVRKHCLMIHYDVPTKQRKQLFSLNKSCKFCSNCQLLIVQQSEVETDLEQLTTKLGLSFNPKAYFIFGTIERKYWKQGQQQQLSPQDILALSAPFKDIWDFHIRPAGWYFDDEQ